MSHITRNTPRVEKVDLSMKNETRRLKLTAIINQIDEIIEKCVRFQENLGEAYCKIAAERILKPGAYDRPINF